MTPTDLTGVLDFLRAAEQLKNQTRSAHTSTGKRESVAEHTWRLCLMAVVLADEFPPDIDFQKLIRICVIHDLGEAIRGDIPAIHQTPGAPKSAHEREDLLQLMAPLPTRLRDPIVALWDEYEAAESPEARLAKGLDKLETILQHNQGANPPDFDYRFNLDYGARYTTTPPLVAAIRAVLDRDTLRRAEGG
ncbi:MAG TPA: HD domain-containing protein [Urbifossiella sp.]|nr:HD domain-containing protein [Urbifossiella sp.]